MPQPFFSICIPTFNMVRWLPFAVDSVLAQSDPDFELLISDNASTDQTGPWLDTLTDPRVKIFRQSNNLGMYGNVNFLVRQARGVWMRVLSADDVMSPICLEAVRAHCQLARFLCHDFTFYEDRLALKAETFQTKYLPPEDFLLRINSYRLFGFSQATCFMHRESFAAIGYYKSKGPDYDYSCDVVAGLEMFLS